MHNTFCRFILVLSLTISGLAMGQELVVRPKPKPGPLDNPLKGWCPYTNAGEIHQPYSMVFQYVTWRELEPSEGRFQFEKWEQSWNVKAAKEKHIVFRVHVDYPSRPTGLPDWLRNAGVKETAYSDHGGGQSPDYDHPKMVKGMQRLIAALGKRYNKHPRVAFVQLGLLGFWGEWHTWPRSKLYASSETERRVIEAYRRAFPDKCLMVRYAKGYAAKQDWIGFHDDMFPEDTDNGYDWSFLSGLRKAKRTNNWRVSVVGGEMVPNQAQKWIKQDFSKTMEMTRVAHFSWIGPYCPALENSTEELYRKNSRELIRKMGYEFQVTEVKHAKLIKNEQPVTVSLQGKNNGVAPFYYRWPIEFALLNATGKVVATSKTGWDIRKWQPGIFKQLATLKFNRVVIGDYDLAIGIRDPWLNRPTIRFANDLEVKNGWTILSRVKVVR